MFTLAKRHNASRVRRRFISEDHTNLGSRVTTHRRVPGLRFFSPCLLIWYFLKPNPLKWSPQSIEASRRRPGRMLCSSEHAGWQSMLVQTFEQPTSVEAYETVASPDTLLVFVLEGSYELESFSVRGWKKAAYHPGVGGLTAPFTTNRLRWSAKTASTSRIVRLYLPQQYFAEAHEAYRRPGRSSNFVLPDALSLSDSTVFSVAKAALAAMEAGAPDLYADVSARFLATHLISRFDNSAIDPVKVSASNLTDRRLRRVLEFMEHEFATALSTDQLAREAGVSPFHFSRIFKAKVGVTPHRHLRALRIKHGRALLAKTDLSVLQVAEACGYLHDGHFAAAFRIAFGCSPRAFRKLLYS